MAFRIIPNELKVKALDECLTLNGKVPEVARKYGIDPDTIRYQFGKLRAKLPEVVHNDKPGPKPAQRSSVRPIVSRAKRQRGRALEADPERPTECPFCGSQVVWKNGTYQVINWLLFFLLGQFLGQKTTIQRYLCAQCGQEIASAHRLRIAAARERAWLIMKRLVALGKFKLFLSHRGIQQLISFVYSKAVSIAFVDGTVQGIGQRARQVLAKLGDCRQRAAQVMMGDETFPKIISAGKAVAKSMAVVICEHGLIRAVRAVKDRKPDLKRAFKAALGYFYQPDYFLSDYDKQYPALVEDILGKQALHLRDLVHTVRLILRLYRETVRDVTLHVPKGTSLKEHKKQKKLKRKLLRKQLWPSLQLFLKAFSPGHEGVAHLYIAAGLQALAEFPVQTATVQRLHKQLTKFFKKYEPILIYQLEHKDELVSTTNSLESKHSIFAILRRRSKSFQTDKTCEATFCGVALAQNFDVKVRGVNQGTSAMQRAGIKLDDLGAQDFFDAVGLALT